MFAFAADCQNLKTVPVEAPDLSHVTDLSLMFYNTKSFNQPIGNWDVSNVKNMRRMFGHTETFDQPIGNWNVSNVEN
ncbi:MAG: BspA family leucine-rich repeat surface protein, partial [Proteobacteria bacterium]|nr:BspA family leucine-rich repeat surface protein [Pseudomonadota bacterium]